MFKCEKINSYTKKKLKLRYKFKFFTNKYKYTK